MLIGVLSIYLKGAEVWLGGWVCSCSFDDNSRSTNGREMGKRNGVGGSGVVVAFCGEEHPILLIRVAVRERCKSRRSAIREWLSLWRWDCQWSSLGWSGSRSTSRHRAHSSNSASARVWGDVMGAVLWSMARSPCVAGWASPFRTFDWPVSPIPTVLADVV